MKLALFLAAGALAGAAAQAGHAWAQGLAVLFVLLFFAWAVASAAARFKEHL